jgi:hypothetical protein
MGWHRLAWAGMGWHGLAWAVMGWQCIAWYNITLPRYAPSMKNRPRAHVFGLVRARARSDLAKKKLGWINLYSAYFLFLRLRPEMPPYRRNRPRARLRARGGACTL